MVLIGQHFFFDDKVVFYLKTSAHSLKRHPIKRGENITILDYSYDVQILAI